MEPLQLQGAQVEEQGVVRKTAPKQMMKFQLLDSTTLELLQREYKATEWRRAAMKATTQLVRAKLVPGGQSGNHIIVLRNMSDKKGKIYVGAQVDVREPKEAFRACRGGNGAKEKNVAYKHESIVRLVNGTNFIMKPTRQQVQLARGYPSIAEEPLQEPQQLQQQQQPRRRRSASSDDEAGQQQHQRRRCMSEEGEQQAGGGQQQLDPAKVEHEGEGQRAQQQQQQQQQQYGGQQQQEEAGLHEEGEQHQQGDQQHQLQGGKQEQEEEEQDQQEGEQQQEQQHQLGTQVRGEQQQQAGLQQRRHVALHDPRLRPVGLAPASEESLDVCATRLRGLAAAEDAAAGMQQLQQGQSRQMKVRDAIALLLWHARRVKTRRLLELAQKIEGHVSALRGLRRQHEEKKQQGSQLWDERLPRVRSTRNFAALEQLLAEMKQIESEAAVLQSRISGVQQEAELAVTNAQDFAAQAVEDMVVDASALFTDT